MVIFFALPKIAFFFFFHSLVWVVAEVSNFMLFNELKKNQNYHPVGPSVSETSNFCCFMIGNTASV